MASLKKDKTTIEIVDDVVKELSNEWSSSQENYDNKNYVDPIEFINEKDEKTLIDSLTELNT